MLHNKLRPEILTAVEWACKELGLNQNLKIWFEHVPLEEAGENLGQLLTLKDDMFVIQVNPEKRINLEIMTIFHELAHVSQRVEKRLVSGSVVYNRIWNGKKCDEDNLSYWDFPWEIEAREVERKLFFAWKKLQKRRKYENFKRGIST